MKTDIFVKKGSWRIRAVAQPAHLREMGKLYRDQMLEYSGEAMFRPVVMRLGNYGNDVLDLFFQLKGWTGW